MASGDAPRRSFLFSFGIDKLGLVALKAPRFSAFVIALITAFAVYGLMNLRVDDSLAELFRTNTKEFRQYEEIDRRFPSSEYDVLVAVDGKNLVTRAGLQAVVNMVVELQLTASCRCFRRVPSPMRPVTPRLWFPMCCLMTDRRSTRWWPL
jgi:predicted RND superfamily exporter protein